MRLSCWSHGPENADDWTEQQIQQFLTGPGGWLILNLHGLDNEGWGPITSKYLIDLLGRMKQVTKLEMLPAGVVLRRTAD